MAPVASMSGDQSIVVAPHYSIIDDMLLNDIVVTPPWEPKKTATGGQQWARGNVRIKNFNGRTTDLVITGPKMRILYSGCQWNKICFADNGDIGVPQFTRWIRDLGRVVQERIFHEPEKFRPGAKTAGRFSFEVDLLKPSSDPSLYSDEVRARLLTQRRVHGDVEIDLPTAVLFTQDEEGMKHDVEPCDIRAGGYLVPIMKVSYYRNVERFGLVLTVLKGIYTPPAQREEEMMQWEFDVAH